MSTIQEARKTHVSDMISPGGISYQLARGNVKNINLRVRPDATVRVSAPRHVSLERIQQFVDSKASWIIDRQGVARRRDEREHASLREGDVVHFWGRELPVRIEVVSSARQEGAVLKDNTVVLRLVERWLVGGEEAREHRAKLADALLRSQLQAALPPLFERFEAQMGVHASAFRLRRMRTRWGSCNTRTKAISINLQLAELPPTCLESVVVHELCHLIEANHGPRFYALMDRHYPGWREARVMLKAAIRG